MTDSRIYIKEVQGHQHRYQKLIQLTHSSTKAAGAMLLAAVVALIVANTAAHEPFLEFWHSHVGFFFGESVVEMSLAHVINDVFMAVFFLLVGLEVKYELTVGELTNIRQALLPIMAAVGGVLAPIAIYLVFNAANLQTVGGWGVPTATDIAFALGILALLGNRVPAGVRVFLSTLAVADDIIAILVIAIFYGQSPSLAWLLVAGVVLAVLVAMNRGHVYSLLPYMLVGALLWYCVYMSGVHSTIAGVLLAFAIPSGSRAYLRPGTHLCEGAKAGTHVEIKKSTIGRGSKVPHLSYIGDTTMGEGVNIGAGSITCNYDGKTKWPTTIGDNVFVGSDTMMVAPVAIGDGAIIGAASCITKEVAPDALALTRPEQVEIPGWAAKKRARQAAEGK